MHSKRKTRVYLNKNDKWRVVLTDTSPFEVPIIVSNDGFYKNLHDINNKTKNLQKLIKTLVVDYDEKSYTIPLRYNIVKDSKSVRTLSLLHPKSQIMLADFYNKYEQLICEYAGRSPFSIRAPKKIGSSFYVPSPVQDANKYKTATVDTEALDNLVRNPASYFTYKGFQRLYNFFASSDHLRLEKKFQYQLSLDISKCFDSIYTHSIAWATKSKIEAKENTSAHTFGNRFDNVMQKLNHNETSGICIGPEVSRIFAEIILSKVDQTARRNLEQGRTSVCDGVDYECRRYVDNYYVFSNDPATANRVEHELSVALREYNLHLNTAKREFKRRPFYSKKSLVIDEINKALGAYWEKIFEVVSIPVINRRALFPKRIYKYQPLFGNFTREIKAACFASEMGYDAVSNYIIGAIRRKVIDLTDDYVHLVSIKNSTVLDSNYRQMLYFLIDVGFYFFTLHPTVASSLRLSHSIVRAAQHLKEHDAEGFDLVKEASLRWGAQLARSPSFEDLLSKNSVIPIEILNILVSIQQFGGNGQLERELISLAKLDGHSRDYFELVVKLFIYGDLPEFANQRNETWVSICERIDSERCLKIDSEAVHLLLDSLACPYINRSERAKLVRNIWKKIDANLGNISIAESEALIDELEQQHWFVRWDGINLLNMIEKKELSSVYG